MGAGLRARASEAADEELLAVLLHDKDDVQSRLCIASRAGLGPSPHLTHGDGVLPRDFYGPLGPLLDLACSSCGHSQSMPHIHSWSSPFL